MAGDLRGLILRRRPGVEVYSARLRAYTAAWGAPRQEVFSVCPIQSEALPQAGLQQFLRRAGAHPLDFGPSSRMVTWRASGPRSDAAHTLTSLQESAHRGTMETWSKWTLRLIPGGSVRRRATPNPWVVRDLTWTGTTRCRQEPEADPRDCCPGRGHSSHGGLPMRDLTRSGASTAAGRAHLILRRRAIHHPITELGDQKIEAPRVSIAGGASNYKQGDEGLEPPRRA